MLKVRSTMQISRRYLLISAESKEKVEKIILDYLGILGWAKAKTMFVKSEKGKIVLAIDRSSLTDVRAAFAMCKEEIKVLRVSGTLKGLGK